MEERRFDEVRIELRRGIVSIPWSSCEALLDQFRMRDSTNVRDAFRRVGTTQPVVLTDDQRTELLAATIVWANLTDAGRDALPEGIVRLESALDDDLVDGAKEDARRIGGEHYTPR